MAALEAQTTVIEKIELRPERPIVFEILSDNFESRNWQKWQQPTFGNIEPGIEDRGRRLSGGPAEGMEEAWRL